jgi:hypothetical protein
MKRTQNKRILTTATPLATVIAMANMPSRLVKEMLVVNRESNSATEAGARDGHYFGLSPACVFGHRVALDFFVLKSFLFMPPETLDSLVKLARLPLYYSSSWSVQVNFVGNFSLICYKSSTSNHISGGAEDTINGIFPQVSR